MEFACSPSRDPGGGTLHLQPSRLHHVDTATALRTLRRTVSRSPSKRLQLQITQAKSPSVSPSSSHQPIPPPLTSRRTIEILPQSVRHHAVPSGDDVPPTAKKVKPNFRRTMPLGGFQQSSTSSKSPMTRALSDSSDQGNASPHSNRSPSEGQENQSSSETSPVGPFSSFSKSKARDHRLDNNAASFSVPAMKHDVGDHHPSQWPQYRSSPLKRSDGVMNLDMANIGSPSAKRRSVCGRSGSFEIAKDSKEDSDVDIRDGSEAEADSSINDVAFRSPLAPKFQSSKRPSFCPRVFDRPSATRLRRSVDFAVKPPSIAEQNDKNRPRTSLDSALSRQGKDPSPDMCEQKPSSREALMMQYARPLRQHPLSQTLSPASPTPSRPEQSSSNTVSIFQSPEHPNITFSKSLPIGALRPKSRDSQLQQDSSQASLYGVPFATPEMYKIAKPDPAAFRSTGLISKRHRNPEALPPPPAARFGMPDTPCKRLTAGTAFPSSPVSVKSIAKPRFVQPEFGTPSRPFSSHSTHPTPESLGKTVSIFGSRYHYGHNHRRGSFISNDGEEVLQSPQGQAESQSSNDEQPPTPTKQAPVNTRPNSLRSSLFNRRASIGPTTFLSPDVSNQQSTQQDKLYFLPQSTHKRNNGCPQTPADATFPDPSGLTISPHADVPISPNFASSLGSSWTRPPETPTTHRESGQGNALQHVSLTPSNHSVIPRDVDPLLSQKFKRIEWYGQGEFSEVYRVYQAADTVAGQSYFTASLGSKASQTPLPDRVWIVKKSKTPYTSTKLRQRKLREVAIMQTLGKHDHVVQLIDHWEADNYLYIQTELCENGTLEAFLDQTGNKGRLDDFRIWKILTELSLGLKHIHDSGFIHFDMKPANVFVDFGGGLKIGDFGMASDWPAPPNVEGEGDRRYIGPDLLNGDFDKPADVFATGMIMYEIAGNCVPPDNGASWQKLRSGDWSGLPSLTSGSTNSIFHDSRDGIIGSRSLDDFVSARPLDTLYNPDVDLDNLDCQFARSKAPSTEAEDRRLRGLDDLARPPAFMLDKDDPDSIDSVVHWMMAHNKEDRPVVDEILQTGGVLWVDERRRAGATVYEGIWGPPLHVLTSYHELDDEEMLDVA